MRDLLRKMPGLDMWQEVKGSHVVVRVPPEHMQTIHKWSPSPLGLHRVLHSNVQQLIDAEAVPSGAGFYHKYHDHDKLEAHWHHLAKKYPQTVKLSVLGKTHENRDIVALHVSAPDTPKDAPEIFVQGGQHAREWIASASTTFVAEALAAGHQSGSKEATKALKHARITLVPLVNPDGYHYTHTKDRMWRKNRNYQKGHSGLCVGVDPNRNWNTHWAKTVADGHVKKDISDRCSSTWGGPFALSEAEPQAINGYIKSRGKSVKGFLDVHSYSQEVLPPGCNGFPIKKSAQRRLKKSASALTSALGVKGARYTTGECAKIMYPCSGTAHDWAFSTMGIQQSYCVEVRPGENSGEGFVLPAKKIIPTSQELLAGVLSLTSEAVPKYKFSMAGIQGMGVFQSEEALLGC